MKEKLVYLDCCGGVKVPFVESTIFFNCPKCGKRNAGSSWQTEQLRNSAAQTELMMLHNENQIDGY